MHNGKLTRRQAQHRRAATLRAVGEVYRVPSMPLGLQKPVQGCCPLDRVACRSKWAKKCTAEGCARERAEFQRTVTSLSAAVDTSHPLRRLQLRCVGLASVLVLRAFSSGDLRQTERALTRLEKLLNGLGVDPATVPTPTPPVEAL